MGVNQDVFQRIEKKYRIASAQREAVQAALCETMAPDAYGRSTITSVYLDTPERWLITRSLEKPLYKEKLRLRTYGAAAGDALIAALRHPEAVAKDVEADQPLVFVELKKKFKGVVYKRRIDLPLNQAVFFVQAALSSSASEAVAYLDEAGCFADGAEEEDGLDAQGALSRRHRQIAQEIAVALGRYPHLAPALAIRCERVAWAPVSPAAEDLRITFDDTLSYLDLQVAEDSWHPVIASDESIMEIKCPQSLPLDLVEVLGAEAIYPSSFSKYGTAHQIEQGLLDECGALYWESQTAPRHRVVPGAAAASHKTVHRSNPQGKAPGQTDDGGALLPPNHAYVSTSPSRPSRRAHSSSSRPTGATTFPREGIFRRLTEKVLASHRKEAHV